MSSLPKPNDLAHRSQYDALFCNSCDTDSTKAWPWPQKPPRRMRTWRKHSDVQACIQSEVLLVFYAHCKPQCWNSVLADNVKCIPEVYWFFTPLQKWDVLCAPKVVWNTYRYFKGPPRESQKMRNKDTVGLKAQCLEDSERGWKAPYVSWKKYLKKEAVTNIFGVIKHLCSFTVPITPTRHGL